MPPAAKLSRTWRVRALSGVAIALLLGGGLWLRTRSRLSPEAAQRVGRARELLLLDDARSLEKATALFTEAARIAAGEPGPEGERAFALLLQAAAWKDLADRLQKDAAAAAERERYAVESDRLIESGLAAAKTALEEDGDDPGALRAMALHAAVLGSSDQGALERARRSGPDDPWVALVSGLQMRRDPDKAVEALDRARRAEPRLLRADVELAAISIDQRKPGSARRALARVLQANPEHERARRLLALLPAR
jgi:tetratricopeptide (TPR) repeat protein